jgi:transcriptional regulator with XRE-family HTH domain
VDADRLAAVALAEHLEAVRARRGITRQDLAALAGISPITLRTALSTGRVYLFTMLAVARVLGVDLSAHSVEDREVQAIVDDIAVERAVRGEMVVLTRLEQAAAVKVMQQRGRSAQVTAETLGVDRRWVNRVRAGEVKYAREVA